MLMINTILRNFLKRPATRKYPMVKRDPFSNHPLLFIFCISRYSQLSITANIRQTRISFKCLQLILRTT